jgi:hypothetical protein
VAERSGGRGAAETESPEKVDFDPSRWETAGVVAPRVPTLPESSKINGSARNRPARESAEVGTANGR